MLDQHITMDTARIKELLLILWSTTKEYLQKAKKLIFPFKMQELPRWKRNLVKAAYTVLFFFLFLGLVDNNFLWLFGKSPRIRDINNPQLSVASEVYSSDGKMLGRFFSENRTPVDYKDLSPMLVKALIATEDVRFYRHHGVDFQATLSVIWYTLKGDRRGGSTITQQLVKNLFKTRSNYSSGLLGHIPLVRTLVVKMKEWINAFKIEFFYSKKEIITMYFNTVDFGHNTFGIKTAARVYFKTTPARLSLQQCAVLIGMLKAPTYYSPLMHPERCKARTNTVLSQMLKYKAITQAQFEQESSKPIATNYQSEDNYDNDSNYVRLAVQWWLREWLKENDYNLYTDGLVIHTTIDSALQKYAETSVAGQLKTLQTLFDAYWQGQNPWTDSHGKEIPGFIEQRAEACPYYIHLAKKYKSQPDSIAFYMNRKKRMKVFSYKGERDTTFSSMDSIRYYKKLLHSGFVTLEPNTGYVKSWVGDLDFKHFKFDNVRQSKRQPGSTFKGFLYAAALDNGYGICDSIRDEAVSIEYTEKGEKKVWAPHNASWEFSNANMTIKYAFAKSINSVAARLTQKLGWAKVIEYAKRMGIRSELENVPSVSLGSSDVSLYELTAAYAPFVNGGYRVSPILVTRIEDREGNVLAEFHPRREKVLSDQTAFLMQQLLQAGLSEPGATTSNLYTYDMFRYNTDFGGKTGTSQNHSDGWFIGVSPNLMGGSWVGCEDRAVHFRSAQGEGSKTALPIFGRFMEKVMKDDNYQYIKAKFKKPEFSLAKNYQCHTPSVKKDSAKLEEKLTNELRNDVPDFVE